MIRFKVKEVAARQGFSQHRLAKESGVDLRTLRRIFQQKEAIVISTDTLDRLATILGVDVSELLESVASPNSARGFETTDDTRLQ